MQTACQRCQAILARILYFQLGRTRAMFVEDIDALHGTTTFPRRCMVCRLLTDYLKDGRRLLVKRASASAGCSRPAGTACSVALQFFPRFTTVQAHTDIVLTVRLDNADELRTKTLLADPNAELGIQGPSLSQDDGPHFDQSQSDLAQANEWLLDCEQWHRICNHRFGVSEPPLPSRVLDLRLAKGGTVRLVDGSELRGKYAALSHCWGEGCSLTTTRATLEDRQTSIQFSDLPVLFQDAVFSTRELGIDYLWIDALCIIQDDLQDWESEAARMADIFRNAHVTLAGTAQSGSEQSLFSRLSFAALRFEVVDTGAVLTWKFRLHPKAKPRDDILFALLNKRGWVLQELMLSRRTLHFSTNQLYWHCSKLARSADGNIKNENGQLSTHGWWYGPDSRLATRTFAGAHRYEVVRAIERLSIARSAAPEMLWWRLVEDYSRRKLSFLSDKLIALAGIASYFQQQDSAFEYAAGMWKHDAVNSLLWSTDSLSPSTGRSPELANIPSWSWASVDQPIRMPRGYGSGQPRRPLLSVEKMRTKHVNDSSSSRILGGELHVRGNLVPVLHEPLFNFHGSDNISLFSTRSMGRRFLCHARTETSYTSLPEHLWLLPVFLDEIRDHVQADVHALLLQRTAQDDARPARYQRVGIASVPREPGDEFFGHAGFGGESGAGHCVTPT